ncbi:hypothetical protein ACQKWADRAFT_7467 [Trichoderma austrokoningii]
MYRDLQLRKGAVTISPGQGLCYLLILLLPIQEGSVYFASLSFSACEEVPTLAYGISGISFVRSACSDNDRPLLLMTSISLRSHFSVLTSVHTCLFFSTVCCAKP